MGTPIRLTDEQMRQYIADGYIALDIDLPRSFHDGVYAKTQEVFAKEGNPGNNVLPRIPELREVYRHPAVDGALRSVLGDGYYMHPHRHCHHNVPGSAGQQMHIDSWTRRRHTTPGAQECTVPSLETLGDPFKKPGGLSAPGI